VRARRSAAPEADARTTRDALLGGRVAFRQPATGYRAAVDPVLLAASVPAATRGSVLELGCGAGAALLCLAHRLPNLKIVGLERDPALAALARDNAAANGMAERVGILAGDLLAPPDRLAGNAFDAVIANPPYLEPGRAGDRGRGAKRAATVEGAADLAAWVTAALGFAKPKGRVVFIHRADRLADLLAAFGNRAGGVVVFPLWPKLGAPAKRVIVTARKGVKSPLKLAAGMVLHEADGRYTPAANAILRDGAGLDLRRESVVDPHVQ
jgi:tRNA1(Val) A37 N6-methylase TrmN6